MIETNKLAVASYGEALWDCIPDGLFLGGAPFNAAYHLASLGVQSYPITCVGDDLLGDQVFERAKSAGLNTDFIKRHEILETGVALAKLDDQGNAEYDIRLPSAWDEIELSAEEMALLSELDAIIYGSLVTRSELSRDTLETLLENFSGLKVCDINLRSPYDDLKRAIHFARLADIVKLNHDELYRVIAANPMDFALEGAMKECALLLGVDRLVVTLAGDGAAYCQDGEFATVESQSIEVADTIGAGDAFTSALVVGLVSGLGVDEVMERANQLGAFVATRSGGQPIYDSRMLLELSEAWAKS